MAKQKNSFNVEIEYESVQNKNETIRFSKKKKKGKQIDFIHGNLY